MAAQAPAASPRDLTHKPLFLARPRGASLLPHAPSQTSPRFLHHLGATVSTARSWRGSAARKHAGVMRRWAQHPDDILLAESSKAWFVALGVSISYKRRWHNLRLHPTNANSFIQLHTPALINTHYVNSLNTCRRGRRA